MKYNPQCGLLSGNCIEINQSNNSLNLELKPEKVVNAKKRTIKKEDLNSIKILLKDELITQEKFDALKKKIENRDKPAVKKPYDPDLEKN